MEFYENAETHFDMFRTNFSPLSCIRFMYDSCHKKKEISETDVSNILFNTRKS